MLTSGCVQTLFFQEQSLNWSAGDDVRVYDLIDIRQGDRAIPHCFGINDKVWSMLALVEASCLVRAHRGLQTSRRQGFFESLVQLCAAVRIAAAPRASGLALIGANKDVVPESWHS